MAISEAYNMDCVEYMKSLPDKYFNLAICDPEYRDVNQPDKSMRKKGSMSGWYGMPGDEFFKELFRVSVDQIIFGGNYFTEFLPPNNNWLIWYKNNDGLHMSMCEMAWVSIRKNTKVFDFRPHGLNASWHPTAKPVRLYSYILKTYSKESFKIFDPYLGSQSSRMAAYDFNLDFYGCELNIDYFNSGNERFKNHASQSSLILDFGL